MIPEIRLVYRLARELARRRTAAAVIVIAGDDNLTDTYGLSTGDSTEKILFHALRNLPSRNYVEFTTGGHFAEAARHLALGMAELWPQFPTLTLHGKIGIPPADRVRIVIQLDGREVARATIAERRPLGEDAARLVQ